MGKRSVLPLADGPLRLRLLEEVDLPLTLSWRNQDHIRRWFLTSEVIHPEQHRQWFAKYRERDDDFVFVIEETERWKRPVGQASIYGIDWTAGRAEFGRLMIGDAEAAGQGLAGRATAMLVALAFETWGLRELVLEVKAENERAASVYRSNGFQIIDTSPSVLRMGLTARNVKG